MSLISLATPENPCVKLYEMLRTSSKTARMANRLLCWWWSKNNSNCFPPNDVAAAIMQCAQTVACNRFCCNGWSYLRACPMSILALLNARLGCTLASLCCSVYCFVGCECPALVTAPKLNCLITDCKVADGYMRIVFLGSEAPYGFLPIFTFSPRARLQLHHRQHTRFGVSGTSFARAAFRAAGVPLSSHL